MEKGCGGIYMGCCYWGVYVHKCGIVRRAVQSLRACVRVSLCTCTNMKCEGMREGVPVGEGNANILRSKRGERIKIYKKREGNIKK